MTPDLADSLAKRYINKLESSNGHICSIMDFFNSSQNSESLNTLLKANLNDVHLAYQTWEDYLQGLAHKQVAGVLQRANFDKQSFKRPTAQPVRPNMYRQFSNKIGGVRGFSTDNVSQKEKIIYSEEYLQRQETAKTAKPSGGKFFDFIQKIDKLDATPATSTKSDYDLSELDITFDKVSRTQDLSSSSKLGADTTVVAKV